jgi:hypothetical protein
MVLASRVASKVLSTWRSEDNPETKPQLLPCGRTECTRVGPGEREIDIVYARRVRRRVDADESGRDSPSC